MDQLNHTEPEALITDAPVIFFSSISGNTARYVAKASAAGDFDTARLPVTRLDPQVRATAPFVLVTPTYGGGAGERAVPRQVVKFLNSLNADGNLGLLRGVISCGNTNFGTDFCVAGDIIAAKCRVPHLHRTEVFGTPEDVDALVQASADLLAMSTAGP
ncbi:class Ib ribonucleoside-diphosphate reductase assembly flavoprotein NrdI (plasmid) [Citricoccus nitrophenolicus]